MKTSVLIPEYVKKDIKETYANPVIQITRELLEIIVKNALIMKKT